MHSVVLSITVPRGGMTGKQNVLPEFPAPHCGTDDMREITMGNKLAGKRSQTESGLSAAVRFTGYLLDGMISIYMMLIIVVMPFYNEQGFTHIGTDKAMFFRRISVYGAWFIGPVLVLYLALRGILAGRKAGQKAVQGRKTGQGQKEGLERKADQGQKAGLWERCRNRLSVTDVFALIYGASLILSYLFSDYKEDTLWGAVGWYMGLLPQLFLLAVYFLISRFWTKKDWMFLLFLPVSAVVFALGYLNRFGIFPIDMKVENVSFISTIGNMNWYCGYLVSVFFGGYYLLWQSGGKQQGEDKKEKDNKGKAEKGKDKKEICRDILLMLYVAVGFASLVTQGSRSGLVALAVVMVVTFCLSAEDGRRMLLFWVETLILSLVCVVTLGIRTVLHGQITFEDGLTDLLTNSRFPLIATGIVLIFVIGISYCNAYGKYPVKAFCILKWITGIGTVAGVCIVISMIILNTLRPGSLGALSENAFFTFSDYWGSGRGVTWKAGAMCFGEQNFLHKLIGVGPDGMETFLYRNGSSGMVEMVEARFGTARLTNAHNEWLTILVNMGVLGCVSYIGMIISAIYRFIKAGNRKNMIAGACGFCLLAYTVNNLFSFQQSMSVATIFVILGIGEVYARGTG